MGTRADFYAGRGEAAEWLGSIAWDGYPDGIPGEVTRATTEEDFRARVAGFLRGRDDGTTPERGWPWPWLTSHTTDYSYAFDGGKVWATNWGYGWFDPIGPEPDIEVSRGKLCTFPIMGGDRVGPPGSERSGTMLISFPRR